MLKFRAILVAICVSGWAVAASAATVKPVHLRCEYLEQPAGIDAAVPRLSWQIQDARRDAMQTAYQIIVASNEAALAKRRGDIWDSGKIASDQSIGVEYQGPAVESRHRYYWRVRIWDQTGHASAYSDASYWEMGLLQPSDWKAEWISGGARLLPPFVDWLWSPGENAREKTEKTPHYFRTTFELPKPHGGTLEATAKDSMKVWVNGQELTPLYPVRAWGTMKTFSLNDVLHSGKNVVAIEADTEGGFAAMAAFLWWNGPQAITGRPGTEWKVSTNAPSDWKSADFDDSSWSTAVPVAKLGEQPFGDPTPPIPASYLRKTFDTAKPIARARVYVTALGSYRLHINGQRVGKDILTPDWTDYRKRVQYQTYDVTDLLKRGRNAIGATLGEGWYGSALGWQLVRYNFGPPPPRLLAQLEIEYKDGSRETIVTDRSWKTAQSPILRSDLYAGEFYDATLETPGWDQAQYADSGWTSARVQPAPTIALSAQDSPTIQVTQELRPETIKSPEAGTYIFDMGQNMVGWVRLKVSGPRGANVQLRFAEILKADGNIYRDNLRAAEVTDNYVLRGGGEEVFEPHFTYHGFRYVEVTGFPGTPTLDNITGIVFHTDNPFTGTFTSSSEMVNHLWRNIRWGQRGNLESIPTDCPQRDERLGWMADAQIFWRTASFNMNMAAFTEKFMRDAIEAQGTNGAFSDVSPRIVDPADGAPAWGDAGVIIPWTAWRQYGDTRVIETSWDAMGKWMEYIRSANPDLLRRNKLNNNFGDWVPANSTTPKDLIATAYWAYDARLMAQMAEAAGKSDNAARYRKLHDDIKAAFIHEYVQPDGVVGNGSQTCYALALHLHLLPEDLYKPAMEKLVDDIKSRDWHLSTGFVGTPYLMQALSENGRDDVAYRLLLNDTYPSWGYMIKKGATTMWERWNGDTGDPAMNSFNHYAYGSVGEWLYRFAAGIDTDPSAAGFKKIVIRPNVASGMTSVNASYDSLYGKIVSDWEAQPGKPFSLHVAIPPNTTATVYVPASNAEAVSAKSAHFDRMSGGYAVYSIGSGDYGFEVAH